MQGVGNTFSHLEKIYPVIFELRKQREKFLGSHLHIILEAPDFEPVGLSGRRQRDGGHLPSNERLRHVPVKPDEGDLRVQDVAEH